MALIVQKFGGTSVADPQRIASVAERVNATREAGNQVVVVVSAMSGITDRLIGYDIAAMLFSRMHHELGDQRFFAGLRRLIDEHGGAHAGWAQVRTAMEASSGEELGQLFDTVLDTSPLPELDLTAEYAVVGDRGAPVIATVTVQRTRPGRAGPPGRIGLGRHALGLGENLFQLVVLGAGTHLGRNQMIDRRDDE